jgi:hypothetical protein
VIVNGIPDTPQGWAFGQAWNRWIAAVRAADPEVSKRTIDRLEEEVDRTWKAAKDSANALIEAF